MATNVTYNPDGSILEEWETPDTVIETQPALLTKLGFVELCQTAGGMTDAKLVEARTDPTFAALWIKLDLAANVNKQHDATLAGLAGLAQAGYLPAGVAAVLSAWPEV